MTHETEWNARQESSHVDKSGWLPGEWHREPDRVEWRFAGTPRFPLLIVRGPSGALCGYVGVPPGHPLHGADGARGDVGLSVHGGITYGSPCQADGHICHKPRPGEADDVWWLGFDCAHLDDLCPKHASLMPSHVYAHDVYRDIDYVRYEVESMAEQCARIAKGLPPEEED